MKRVTIIGCGSISKYIFRPLIENKDFCVRAVCDLSYEKAQAYATDGIKAYTDYKKMLSEVDCDIVILLVHHFGRDKILEDLLERKYIVICEKPLIWSQKQYKELKDICDKYSNYPITMYHRSWNSSISEVMEFCTHEKIEEIIINYLEEIQVQTGETENIIISDVNGGGCINDNFPNCIHYLLSRNKVELIKATGKLDDVSKYTMKANIDLNWGQIPCKVNLDWHSKYDEKSISIVTSEKVIKFDLQGKYEVGKDSLYDEYKSLFENLNHIDILNEFRMAGEIGSLLEKVHENCIYNK